MTDQLWNSLVIDTSVTTKIYNWTDPTISASDTEDVILIKRFDSPKIETLSHEEFLPKFHEALQEIRPHLIWTQQSKVLELPDPTFGCHIRFGDPVHGGKGIDYIDQYKPSTPQAFIRDMQVVIAHEPEVHFYVATEFPDIMEQMVQAFPGRIVQWPEKKWIHRLDEGGLEQALVELLILSRCRAILGSVISSYSQLAAQLGNLHRWVIHEEKQLVFKIP